jgi:hypothetical protein
LKYDYYLLVSISPLAEGSDRLIAREILNFHNSGNGLDNQLITVLPFKEEEYAEDFIEQESKDEFYNLLGKSVSKLIIQPLNSKERSYEEAGHCVVNNSDILIVIWNGKEANGKGGTAEIVEYARKKAKPLFWINSTNGKLNQEGNWDEIKRSVELYNKGNLYI